MKLSYGSHTRSRSRLRLVAAILAVIGQVGFSSASLSLARDESSAISHAEQTGVDLHHGHNEANCAACIALSLQAAVSGRATATPAGELSREPVDPGVISFIAAPQLLPNSCRAPPREV